jgi:hypothetical protein
MASPPADEPTAAPRRTAAASLPAPTASTASRPRRPTAATACAPSPSAAPASFALERMATVIAARPRATVRHRERGWLHAEFRSRLFGYVDDVDVEVDAAAGVLRLPLRLPPRPLGPRRQPPADEAAGAGVPGRRGVGGLASPRRTSATRDHRPRRPRQDDAGRRHALAERHLPRQRGRRRAGDGLDRPRARAGITIMAKNTAVTTAARGSTSSTRPATPTSAARSSAPSRWSTA